MKKKSLIIAIVLSLITIFTIGTTVSYYTDEADVTNNIIMGRIDIDIEEKIVEDGKEMVGATNVGLNPAWVRVFVGLPEGTDGKAVYTETMFVDGNITNPDTNGEGWNWSEEADGYYYYSDPINPGDTAYLFSSIMRSETIEEDELPSNIDIIIYTEAIQVSLGNSAIGGFENLKE